MQIKYNSYVHKVVTFKALATMPNQTHTMLHPWQNSTEPNSSSRVPLSNSIVTKHIPTKHCVQPRVRAGVSSSPIYSRGNTCNNRTVASAIPQR